VNYPLWIPTSLSSRAPDHFSHGAGEMAWADRNVTACRPSPAGRSLLPVRPTFMVRLPCVRRRYGLADRAGGRCAGPQQDCPGEDLATHRGRACPVNPCRGLSRLSTPFCRDHAAGRDRRRRGTGCFSAVAGVLASSWACSRLPALGRAARHLANPDVVGARCGAALLPILVATPVDATPWAALSMPGLLVRQARRCGPAWPPP
jgi:hypothetical protein